MSKLGACVDGTLTWIGNNKLATFLGLVAFSLMNLRLSESVFPIYYDLLLHPDLTPGELGGDFNGAVKITLNITEETDVIVLHSHELTILSVNFSTPDMGVIESTYELLPEMEQLKVKLDSNIPIGDEYILDIDFEGSLRDKIVGFYSSTYKDPEGNDR
ncbi:CLUMA_CG002671, isoform A [Clunio marinus]|uniref:CLUMA_CG002671, isoform A n=1 Tax=Clunio marinus TaxID=568069 RepID=A0A1J1HLK9_9DIPT|nr:CLUMA_CG002671, isoform A [Clunio marinus]